MASASSSAMVVEQSKGCVSETTVSDASLLAKCKAEHQHDVARAISHELVANNHTWAIKRRDSLVKAGLMSVGDWKSWQSYELLAPGEKPDYKFNRYTLKVASDSYMPKAAAEGLCNITSAELKDSTFGQGFNLAMLTLSRDVQAEIYAYDALETEEVAGKTFTARY